MYLVQTVRLLRIGLCLVSRTASLSDVHGGFRRFLPELSETEVINRLRQLDSGLFPRGEVLEHEVALFEFLHRSPHGSSVVRWLPDKDDLSETGGWWPSEPNMSEMLGFSGPEPMVHSLAIALMHTVLECCQHRGEILKICFRCARCSM